MVIRYAPTKNNHGFDGSASPAWQMVPLTETRELRVTGSGTLIPRMRHENPLVPNVVVTKTGSGAHVLLSLYGFVAGRSWVEWVPTLTSVDPVATSHTLEVSVKAQKKIRTAFFYVSDGKKQITKRKIDDLDKMIAGANAILQPQANVKLERKSAAALSITQDLGNVVRFSRHLEGAPHNVDPAQHEWDIVTGHKDTAADFNVFFVRRYEQDATPHTNDTLAGTIAADKSCIFEDDVYSASEVLAHETVHYLGISSHVTIKHNLMVGIGKGRKINKDQANTINTSGT